MSAVLSWIALGGAVGYAAAGLPLFQFRARRAYALVAGAAGGFVGGGMVALLAERASTNVDAPGLVAAAATGALIVLAIGQADLAEPGPKQ